MSCGHWPAKATTQGTEAIWVCCFECSCGSFGGTHDHVKETSFLLRKWRESKYVEKAREKKEQHCSQRQRESLWAKDPADSCVTPPQTMERHSSIRLHMLYIFHRMYQANNLHDDPFYLVHTPNKTGRFTRMLER